MKLNFALLHSMSSIMNKIAYYGLTIASVAAIAAFIFDTLESIYWISGISLIICTVFYIFSEILASICKKHIGKERN